MRIIALAAVATLTAAPVMADTKSFDLSNFSQIDVQSGITVNVTISDAFSVRADAEREKDFSDLEIRVTGDTLHIGRPTRWSGLSLLKRRPDISVTVTMPNLEGLEAGSGSDLSVNGTVSGDLDIEATSGATVAVENGSLDRVWIEASSGGLIEVAGNCEAVSVEASSGGRVDAGKLECEDLRADASSGADIDAFASSSADAQASSGAHISVYGEPADYSEEESSGGNVRRR